jgi:hypothetical protein
VDRLRVAGRDPGAFEVLGLPWSKDGMAGRCSKVA